MRPPDVEVEVIDRRRVRLKAGGVTLRECPRGWADYYALIEQRRLALAAGQDRACLCCGASFRSEGAHHRMCDCCRRMT